MAEVIVVLDKDLEVCATITAHSAERLELATGDGVWVVFDASAVVLSVAWIE